MPTSGASCLRYTVGLSAKVILQLKFFSAGALRPVIIFVVVIRVWNFVRMCRIDIARCKHTDIQGNDCKQNQAFYGSFFHTILQHVFYRSFLSIEFLQGANVWSNCYGYSTLLYHVCYITLLFSFVSIICFKEKIKTRLHPKRLPCRERSFLCWAQKQK